MRTIPLILQNYYINRDFNLVCTADSTIESDQLVHAGWLGS